jgi:hypothetical protein
MCPASARVLAGPSHLDTHAVVNSARSNLRVIKTDTGEVVDTDIEGAVYFEGGLCEGSECAIGINGIHLTAKDFVIDGKQMTEVRVFNEGVISGQVRNGHISTDRSSILLYGGGRQDDERISGEAPPLRPVTGIMHESDGRIELLGSFFSADGTLEVHILIRADFANRPPVVDDIKDVVTECTSDGKALVHLSAGSTHDPDPGDEVIGVGWFKANAEGEGTELLTSGFEAEAWLPVGETPIVMVAVDRSGAGSTSAFSVRVEDPGMKLDVDLPVDCIWPPQHDFVRFEVGRDILATAKNACTGETAVARIVSVESNESVDALGSGNTAPDALFDDSTVCLRTERAGPGTGRVYTINIEADGGDGQILRDTVRVRVPHSQRRMLRCSSPSGDLEFVADGDERCDLEHEGTSPGRDTASGGCSATGAPRPRVPGALALGFALLVSLAMRRRFRRRGHAQP